VLLQSLGGLPRISLRSTLTNTSVFNNYGAQKSTRVRGFFRPGHANQIRSTTIKVIINQPKSTVAVAYTPRMLLGHRKRQSEEAADPYRLYIHALMRASLQARCQPQFESGFEKAFYVDTRKLTFTTNNKPTSEAAKTSYLWPGKSLDYKKLVIIISP